LAAGVVDAVAAALSFRFRFGGCFLYVFGFLISLCLEAPTLRSNCSPCDASVFLTHTHSHRAAEPTQRGILRNSRTETRFAVAFSSSGRLGGLCR
jgi:hypothetical protein